MVGDGGGGDGGGGGGEGDGGGGCGGRGGGGGDDGVGMAMSCRRARREIAPPPAAKSSQPKASFGVIPMQHDGAARCPCASEGVGAAAQALLCAAPGGAGEAALHALHALQALHALVMDDGRRAALATAVYPPGLSRTIASS